MYFRFILQLEKELSKKIIILNSCKIIYKVLCEKLIY